MLILCRLGGIPRGKSGLVAAFCFALIWKYYVILSPIAPADKANRAKARREEYQEVKIERNGLAWTKGSPICMEWSYPMT